MDLLANDLSFHEQFQTIEAFQDAFSHFMLISDVAKRYGRKVYCGWMLKGKTPIPDTSLQKALNSYPKDRKRAAMSWIDKGPFWNDDRQHREYDWIECGDEIVTDTAIGEAGFRTFKNLDCGLVSLPGTNWNYDPVEVIYRKNNGAEGTCVTLKNWWCATKLKEALKDIAPPAKSWNELEQTCINQFEKLKFAQNCFDPLKGLPFASPAAKKFLCLFEILENFSRSFDEAGKRTPNGHKIYQDHFTGDSALFSDSSASEKQKFSQDLTFNHPVSKKPLFCPWHGKVSAYHEPLRLHFSWPVRVGSGLYA